MALSDLTQAERYVVRSCLRAAVDGPFFPDPEFHTIFGLTRDDLAGILDRWPTLDDREGTDAHLAINNAFNNLLGYPHGEETAWSKYVATTPQEVARVFAKWKSKPVKGYFSELD